MIVKGRCSLKLTSSFPAATGFEMVVINFGGPRLELTCDEFFEIKDRGTCYIVDLEKNEIEEKDIVLNLLLDVNGESKKITGIETFNGKQVDNGQMCILTKNF